MDSNWQSIIPYVVGVKVYNNYAYTCGNNVFGYIQIGKFSLDGEKIFHFWETVRSGSSVDVFCKGITVNSSGVYIISALFSDTGTTLLSKYSHDGDFIFHKQLTGTPTGIDSTENVIYITGYSGSNAMLISINNSGIVNWSKTYTVTVDTVRTSRAYSVSACFAGTDYVYIAGQYLSPGGGDPYDLGFWSKIHASTGEESYSYSINGNGLSTRLNSIHAKSLSSGSDSGFVGGSVSDGTKSSAISCSLNGALPIKYTDATRSASCSAVRYVQTPPSGVNIVTPCIAMVFHVENDGSYVVSSRSQPPFQAAFVKGKKLLGATSFACDVTTTNDFVYSAHKFSSSSSLMKTSIKNVLFDGVASIWGPATVSDLEQQLYQTYSYGRLSIGVDAANLSISPVSFTTSNKSNLPSYGNYNYASNKAV